MDRTLSSLSFLTLDSRVESNFVHNVFPFMRSPHICYFLIVIELLKDFRFLFMNHFFPLKSSLLLCSSLYVSGSSVGGRSTDLYQLKSLLPSQHERACIPPSVLAPGQCTNRSDFVLKLLTVSISPFSGDPKCCHSPAPNPPASSCSPQTKGQCPSDDLHDPVPHSLSELIFSPVSFSPWPPYSSPSCFSKLPGLCPCCSLCSECCSFYLKCFSPNTSLPGFL